MRNIKLTIEYDGKDFNGWQKQPNKLNIQGTIEQAIKSITCEDVELNASGRTDAGVHALGQVANFKIETSGELTEEHPKTYHKVKVDYHFYGTNLDEKKLEKAVNLSVEKYCGVMEMFRQFAKVEVAIFYHKI